MTPKNSKKSVLIIVTYAIALVCLLLGLLLPFVNGSSMLATMLPSALGNVIGNETLQGTGTAFTDAGVNFFGLFSNPFSFNSLLILIYAVITVVGIFLFIPVVITKNKKTAFTCATVAEVIATIVLTLYIVSVVSTAATENLVADVFAELFSFDWPIICIAFLGTVVMLVIQTIYYYHRDGEVKFIMWLVSALAIFCMFSVYTITNVLSSASLFVKVNGSTNVSGFYIVNYFVTQTFGDSTVYYFNSLGYEASILGTIVSIILSVGIMLAIFNHIVDIICLGAKTTKGGLYFDFFRYLVEVALLVCSIVMLYVMSALEEGCDVKPALMLYIVTVAGIFSMFISAARRADTAPKKAKVVISGKKKSKKTAEPVVADVDDRNRETVTPASVPVAEVAPYPAAPGAPYGAPVYGVPGATSPIYITFYGGPAGHGPAPAPARAPYTVSSNPPAAPASAQSAEPAAPAEPLPEPYSGPTDPFIDKLSETEKLEFEKLFINKENGSFDGVPDYKIGCNNKPFFNAIFLHLTTFRTMLSEGLLAKIYDESNS